jgi:hypothetical protein
MPPAGICAGGYERSQFLLRLAILSEGVHRFAHVAPRLLSRRSGNKQNLSVVAETRGGRTGFIPQRASWGSWPVVKSWSGTRASTTMRFTTVIAVLPVS